MRDRMKRMKDSSILVLVLCLTCSLAWTAGAAVVRRSVYANAVYGFSLNPPQFPAAPRGSLAPAVTMLAPLENGFSSNVKVWVELAPMSAKAYRDRSVRSFRQL